LKLNLKEVKKVHNAGSPEKTSTLNTEENIDTVRTIQLQ